MIRLMVKYGVVGVLGTVLHFASLYALVEWLGLRAVLASAFGFLLVLLVSYVLNRRWTFQSTPSGWGPLLKYCIVSVTGLGLNVALMYVSVDLLHWHYLIGQCTVVVAVPLSNFILNYYWTFRPSATPECAEEAVPHHG
ncbi:GtrA family protein [Paenibacillus allorhizosphaerae]|uniref:GtrA/DPMS transmembrane domain-containing protein n=1 Tax=Paenibacillus allorhizosphaerae TaxID=2849866 RepID=A0ABN7TM96_9BACL|nr:GtrA family protein [Paenibacillus allorhizosphaerae]CAG7646727.1 hypothetical protein PAECIP111802_03816 [Paenibacillus allorhizosphaerae]